MIQLPVNAIKKTQSVPNLCLHRREQHTKDDVTLIYTLLCRKTKPLICKDNKQENAKLVKRTTSSPRDTFPDADKQDNRRTTPPNNKYNKNQKKIYKTKKRFP